MPCQSENRALYSVQVIHTQTHSQLMNSTSGGKKKKSFTAAEKFALRYKIDKQFLFQCKNKVQFWGVQRYTSSHTHTLKKTAFSWKTKGSGVVCFFCLWVSKGESKFRSESYGLQIHAEVRDQGSRVSKTPHLSDLPFCQSTELREPRWHRTCGAHGQTSWTYALRS